MENRVPKFRAWDRRKNIFYYTDNNITVWVGGLECSVNGRDKQICNVPYEDIEQYIGRKDKNGVEIYEGDIISTPRYKCNAHLIIKWSDEEASFVGEHIGVGGQESFDEFEDCEIIGNVHQNPKLMEADNG